MADAKTERQKVKEITDRLEEGLKELFEGDRYKSYLSTMSKFHNYSANNIQLIAMQRPDATYVAGYKAWQKNFERQVNRGEKGIRILAPAPYKIKEEREKVDPVTNEPVLDRDGMPIIEEVEVKIPAFRVVTVFDVAQTEGKELPGLGVDALQGNVENYQDFMEALGRFSPVPIGYETMGGERKGYFHDGEHRIAIKEGMGEAQTAKTAVHEIAHAKLHAKEMEADLGLLGQKDRETKEVEAESIAYTVCQHFGIDTSDYSFGYIAGWSSGKELPELKSSLDTIRRAASELITGIEAQLLEIGKERAMGQTQEDMVSLVEDTDGSRHNPLSGKGMDREAQLLYGTGNQFGIYQLKHTEGTRDMRFMPMDYLEKNNIPISRENYELVYTGELEEGVGLEDIYTKFNIDHPADFTGHSLSVSDVVVLHQDRENTSHYVDSFGYREVPEFTKGLAVSAEVSTGKREMTPEEIKDFVKQQFEHQLKDSGLDDVSFYMDRFDALYEQGKMEHLMPAANQERAVEDMPLDGQEEAYMNVDSREADRLETELAFQLADRYISIQETSGGYDYTIYDMDYRELEGGMYDNKSNGVGFGITIRQAVDEIVADLKEPAYPSGLEGGIQAGDELIPIDYDGLMEKVEQAEKGHLEERIKNEVPEVAQSKVIADFKAKTEELFNAINGHTQEDIELDVYAYLQSKIEEYGMDVKLVDVVVSGSRCRGLEKAGSDLDVVVEYKGREKEDALFNIFHEDGFQIGGVEVDINPITEGKTGTLAEYLPGVEAYLEGVREAREQKPRSIFSIRMNDEERFFENTSSLDADALCRAYGECGRPFVEMGQYGRWIDIGEFADIQQGDRLAFSIQFDEETDRITIFDGENFEHKGLRETVYPDQAGKDIKVTLTVAECGEFHNFGEYHEGIAGVEEAVAIFNSIPPSRRNGIPSIGINIHTEGTEPYEDTQMDIVSGGVIDLEMLEFYPEITGNQKAMGLISELVSKFPDAEMMGSLDGWLPVDMQRSEPKLDAQAENIAEYKPLAKIEELEECNYNMIDNVLNNEKPKEEKGHRAGRISIKEKLVEKKEAARQKDKAAKESPEKRLGEKSGREM